VSSYATQLIVLIGLAVAVDYSLFMISRFRSERRRGRDTLAAIEVASGTAGRAVFFSGLAVVVSLAGLLLMDEPLFHSMALGTIAVVVVSVAGSLTFLPAVLAILGRRVDMGRIPVFGRDRDEGTGFWSRVVHVVMRRPAVWAGVTAAGLLLLASPLLHLRLGQTDITAFPDSIEGVAAIKQLQEHFPQGTTLSLDVYVTRADAPEVKAAFEPFRAAMLTVPGLSESRLPIAYSRDGTVARIPFSMSGDQNDERNHEIVRTVRMQVVPGAFGGLPYVEGYVGGRAASVMDRTEVFANRMPLVFAFVLALSFVLLMLAFHSLVIPLKALLLNLLSAGAAYGAMILVFQDGWFASALGIKPTGVIEAWVPIFIFTILFGLSMDYHVFILTRVKEARDRGLSSNDAVARGIAVTSGVVTSAAAIMVVVFAVFVTLRLVIIQQLGLGLAVAVLIDATLIRSVLLPASMRLLGEWNWWMPRWLGWLPRVTIEAEPEDDPDGDPAARDGRDAGGATPGETATVRA
jgi:RND superfamily putative drug exporter